VQLSFASVAVVAAVAVVAPLILDLTRVRLPGVVVEIVLGILIGPHVLGWAEIDEPVRVLALLGLAFLLLLAGLEIDPDLLRGHVLRRTLAGFAITFGLALLAGYGLRELGLVRSPLLIAIILSATGLGIILPILKDAGETSTALGRVIIAAATVAEVAPIVLLSLFFSGTRGSLGAKVALLAAFIVFVVAVAGLILGLERSRRITDALIRLQDTSAQIRVRGTFLLLTIFVVLASRFGLEAILGAFFAGATLRVVDHDETMTHTFLRPKLEAAGFGIFIPCFFVSTGMALDVGNLFRDSSTLARVPIFLIALLAVHGLPTLAYRAVARPGQVAGAALLQATSLSIPVVAGQIGVGLGLISGQSYIALVAAGLLSVIVFPLVALPLLPGRTPSTAGNGSPSVRAPAG
jgi:Kef-type K+ transport system membrane component KefB